MGTKEIVVNKGGIGFGSLLFLLFLGLELTGYITWSWWVTAPLWGPLVVVLGAIAGVLGIFGIAHLFIEHKD